MPLAFQDPMKYFPKLNTDVESQTNCQLLNHPFTKFLTLETRRNPFKSCLCNVQSIFREKTRRISKEEKKKSESTEQLCAVE